MITPTPAELDSLIANLMEYGSPHLFISLRLTAAAAIRSLRRDLEEARAANAIQIRFDGPPGPEAGRFVEVETLDGHSSSWGEWVQDGEYWLLRATDSARAKP
jgi:hypothetical protein